MTQDIIKGKKSHHKAVIAWSGYLIIKNNMHTPGPGDSVCSAVMNMQACSHCAQGLHGRICVIF